jgi:hypothetical protein
VTIPLRIDSLRRNFLVLSLAFSLLPTQAMALEATDAGSYAVIHRDGHVTDFVFRVVRTANTWNVEQRKPDGSWQNVTCERDCILRASSWTDIERFFPANLLAEMKPSCMHNTAFAFCNYSLVKQPGKGGHIFIALVTPSPIPLKLKKLPNDAQ